MQHVNTRDRIKDAALALFVQHGYAKTTIGAIEHRAGLAPRAGAFYRHFESKEALLIELAETRIAESPDEFHFDQLAAYGSTRAELVAIAQTYEKASRRQQPYLRVIEEVRRIGAVAALDNHVNAALMDALMRWVGTKPAAAGLPGAELAAMTLNVFGSWLFYLGKRQQGIRLDVLQPETLLDVWATFWANVLDQPPSPPAGL